MPVIGTGRGPGRRVAVLWMMASACVTDVSGSGSSPGTGVSFGSSDGVGSSSTGFETTSVSAGESGSESDGSGSEGVVCTPGELGPCLCPDGITLGEATCVDGAWGDCACATDGSDDGTDGGSTEGTTGESATEVCYPGQDESWTTCFPLHTLDGGLADYVYPEPYQGNPNYRQPIAFIDLMEIAPTTFLAPNFRLNEIATVDRGRYAIIQPHAVESLQGLRDVVGAIIVNSGYRSPAYNVQVGGVASSRHIYGDGFDLDPVSVSLDVLEVQCTTQGGVLIEYDTHVHCDYRDHDVAVEFFGEAPIDAMPWPELTAWIEEVAEGVFVAPADGFDEGPPRRRWKGFDAAGEVVLAGEGYVFEVPPEVVRVAVDVGRQVQVSFDRSVATVSP